MSAYLTNDGQFPDDFEVWTPYPLTDDKNTLADRDNWPWLRGQVIGQGGPDEWHIVIDVPALTEYEDGVEWRPACFRNSCELRLIAQAD
ncbi:hypothetical protein AB0P21_28550 [Kribbella sp. NPDC056861]|uniref:hypothetical protein n=1 Tax=Kribbella sp. NPDC056861 TaxID=3154857 RepID=UPI003431FAB9